MISPSTTPADVVGPHGSLAAVPTAPLLQARGLTRSFGSLTAVDAVDLSLEPGRVISVFGPNGAGKTTLLRMLGGGLRPTSGEVLIGGEPMDPRDTAWRGRIGVLSHQTYLYGSLTASENLRFYARLYGARSGREDVEPALRGVGLLERAHDPVRAYSRGMRQRLALARTLLHDPDVVLLDEPYTGLDAHAATVLRQVLSTLKDGRRAVVLVTHNLSEGLEFADEVVIQVRGRVVHRGPPPEDRTAFAGFYREHVESALLDGAGLVGFERAEPAHRARREDGLRDAPNAEATRPSDAKVRSPRYIEQLTAVVWKDLLVELRTRDRIAAMAAFTVLVGVLFNFAMDTTLVRAQDIASGLIWMTLVFAGILGVGRTFRLEAEDGAFQGILMSPAPKDAVYLGKVVSNYILLMIVVLLIMGVFGLFFSLDFGERTLTSMAVVALGALGFVALTTLFAAIASGTRMGETLLPVLVFPPLVPMVVYGVAATGRLLAGRPFAEVSGNVRLLAAFTLLSLLSGAILFRHVVEE